MFLFVILCVIGLVGVSAIILVPKRKSKNLSFNCIPWVEVLEFRLSPTVYH